MISNTGFPNRGFLAGWILRSMLGYVLGYVGGFVFGYMLLGNVMIGLAIGTLVCTFQRLSLRRHFEQTGLWVAAGAVALFISFMLLALFTMTFDYPFDLGWPHGALGYLGAFAVGGALTGLFQLRLLGQKVPRPFHWIWISAIAWGVSLLGVVAFDAMISGKAFVNLLSMIAGALLGGALLGLITGIGLIRMASRDKVTIG